MHPVKYFTYQVLFVLLTSLEAFCEFSGRVAGGIPAQEGQAPWQLSVRIRGLHVCSGALIEGANGTQFALTTAHCLLSPPPSTKGGYPPNVVSVIAGRVDINEYMDDEQERNATWLWAKWNQIERNNHNWDICLISLDSNFEKTSRVGPIPLASLNQRDPEDGHVTVSGWGFKDENITEKLRIVRMPIVNWNDCYVKYFGRHGLQGVIQESVCAGSPTAQTCVGDEGSPAVGIEWNGDRGQPYLWGIFQYTEGDCPDTYYPGVYASIAKYRGWIDEVTTSPHQIP